MDFSNIITVDRIACGIEGVSKKRTLELLSQLICSGHPNLHQNEVFDSLIAREKLGSTALGKGLAIPHGRLKSSDQTIAAFVQLSNGIDFDSPDSQPVDLLCALLVPPECSEEHLEVLATLSEMFSMRSLREELRNSNDTNKIYTLLVSNANEISKNRK